jgi:hypothetical protein
MPAFEETFEDRRCDPKVDHPSRSIIRRQDDDLHVGTGCIMSTKPSRRAGLHGGGFAAATRPDNAPWSQLKRSNPNPGRMLR